MVESSFLWLNMPCMTTCCILETQTRRCQPLANPSWKVSTLHVACLVWDAMSSFCDQHGISGLAEELARSGRVIRQAVPLTVLQVSKLEHDCRSPCDRCLVGGVLALLYSSGRALMELERGGWCACKQRSQAH